MGSPISRWTKVGFRTGGSFPSPTPEEDVTSVIFWYFSPKSESYGNHLGIGRKDSRVGGGWWWKYSLKIFWHRKVGYLFELCRWERQKLSLPSFPPPSPQIPSPAGSFQMCTHHMPRQTQALDQHLNWRALLWPVLIRLYSCVLQHNGRCGGLGHELVFRQIGQCFLNFLSHMSTQEWDNEWCAEVEAVGFNKNNISKPAKPQTHGRQMFLNQILAPLPHPSQLNYNKSSHYSHYYRILNLSLHNISHSHVFTCLIHSVAFLIVPSGWGEWDWIWNYHQDSPLTHNHCFLYCY